MENKFERNVNGEEEMEESSMRIVYVANTSKELNENNNNANSSSSNTSPHSPHSATMPFVMTNDAHSSVGYSTRVPNNNINSNFNNERYKRKIAYTVALNKKEQKRHITNEMCMPESERAKIVNTRLASLLYNVKDAKSTRHLQNKHVTKEHNKQINITSTVHSNDLNVKSKENSKTHNKKHNTVIFDRAPASMPFFSMTQMRSSMERLREEERHQNYHNCYNNGVSKESPCKVASHSKEVARQNQLRGSNSTILPTFHIRTSNVQIPHVAAASAPTPESSMECKRKTHSQELQEHPQPQNIYLHREAVSMPILSSLSLTSASASTSLSLLPSELSYTSLLPSIVAKRDSNSIRKEEQEQLQEQQNCKTQSETKFTTIATQTSIIDENANDRHAHNRRERSEDNLPDVSDKGKAGELAQNSTSAVRSNEGATTAASKQVKPEEKSMATLTVTSELNNNALLQEHKAREIDENKITKQCKSVRFSGVCNKTSNTTRESKSVQTQNEFVMEKSNTAAESSKSKSTKAIYTSSTGQCKHMQRESMESAPSAHIPHVTQKTLFIHKEEYEQQQMHKEEEVEAKHPHLIKLISINEGNKEEPEIFSEYTSAPFRYHKTGLEVSPSRVDVLPAINLSEQEQEEARENDVLHGNHNERIKDGKRQVGKEADTQIFMENCKITNNAPSLNNSNNQETLTLKIKESKTKITVSRKVQTDMFPYMEQLITKQPLTRRDIHDYIDVEESEQEECQQQKRTTTHLSASYTDKNVTMHTNSLSHSSLEQSKVREEVNLHSCTLHERRELSQPLSTSSSLMSSREKLSPFPTRPSPPPPFAVQPAPMFSTSILPHENANNNNNNNINNINKINNNDINSKAWNINVHINENGHPSKLSNISNSNKFEPTGKLWLSPHVQREHNSKPTLSVSTTHLESVQGTEAAKVTELIGASVQNKKFNQNTDNVNVSEEWEHALTEPLQIKIATTTVTTAQNNTRYVPLNVPLDIESVIHDDERDRQSLLLATEKKKEPHQQQLQLQTREKHNEHGASHQNKLEMEASHSLNGRNYEMKVNEQVANHHNTMNSINCGKTNIQRRETIEKCNTQLPTWNVEEEKSSEVMHSGLTSCCKLNNNVIVENSTIEEREVKASNCTRKNISQTNRESRQEFLPLEEVSLENKECIFTEQTNEAQKMEAINARLMLQHLEPTIEHTKNNNCTHYASNAYHELNSESTDYNNINSNSDSHYSATAIEETLEKQKHFLLQRHTQQMVTGQLRQNTRKRP